MFPSVPPGQGILAMTMKKISQLASRLSLRNSRVSSTKKSNKNRPLEFFTCELEKRQLLASFSYSSGVLTVQTTSNNEQLSILSSSDSGNYTLTTSGSWSGSASDINISGTSLFVNQPSGLASILVNDNSGAITGSTFSFGSSSGNFVNSLSVNYAGTSGQLTVGNSANFKNGSNLSLMGRNIAVTANITSQAGDITLYGNGGGSYQAGSFDGVCISGSTVNVNTTGGSIWIDGRGASGVDKHGVNISGSKVSAGGSGSISVRGVSSNGSSNSFGVAGILADGASVTTNNGTLAFNGTSCVTTDRSFGTFVSDSNISATGSGEIVVIGDNASYGSGGIYLGAFVRTSCVTTNNGPISIYGVGRAKGMWIDSSGIVASGSGSINVNGTVYGADSGAQGVLIATCNFSTTGTGNIIINGNASNITSVGSSGVYFISDNFTTQSGQFRIFGNSCGTGASSGISLNANAIISSASNGSVSLTGTVTSTSGFGIDSRDTTAKVNSNGGQITLTANTVNLTGTVNATLAGDVLIQTLGAGVNLGGSDSAAKLGLTSAEIGQITANLLTIGNSTQGDIFVTSAVSVSANVSLALLACTTSNSITVGAALSATGTGGISLTARNISVSGNINSQAGDITLYGNGGGVYQSGLFDGVFISGSTVNVNTTGGSILIEGRGSLNSNLAGVNLVSSKVNAGGSGCVTITGMSSNGSANLAFGLYSVGACVTTNSGALVINGTSCVTGLSGIGVRLMSSTNISSTGAGNVTITGTAVTGAGYVTGIYLGSSRITSNSGSLTAISVTSGADYTYSFTVDNSCITTSSGSITLSGTSCGTGTNPRGVYVQNSSNISASSAGNVTITGSTAGNLSTGVGMIIQDIGSKVYSNGGQIAITANSQILNGAVDATTIGNVMIQTLGAGVDLGGNDTAANLGLTSAEIGLITAGCLTIGNSTTGNIAVTAAITRPANSNLVLIANNTSSCISVGAALSVSGSGSISMSGRNIVVTGNITSQAGDITLYGNGGGSYQAGSFDGVCISGSTVNVNTTSGNITIDGRGASGGAFHGINTTSSIIYTGSAGNILLSGVSGNTSSPYAHGIVVGFSNIISNDGSIVLNGYSCGTSHSEYGVSLYGNVSSVGNGAITITGNSGSGAAVNQFGVVIWDGSKLATANGAISITGTTCGTASDGVRNSGFYTTDTNCITAGGIGSITVIGKTNQANQFGIELLGTLSTFKTAGGAITLSGDKMNLSTSVNATMAGNVTIQPLTSGKQINLGGADSDNTLGLLQSEISQIKAGTLIIGNIASGNITISAPVTWPSNLTMLTAGNITGWANLTVGGTVIPSPPYIMVTNANDSGAGSLRDAIALASNSTGDDQIQFDNSISGNTIALLTPLTINDTTGNLTIVGLGASNLIISGNGSSGIFNILTRANISSLTLTSGYGTGLTNGGAIYSNTTLGLTNLIINNSTSSLGSAVYQTGGSLTVTSSNIVNSIYVTGSGNISVIGGSLDSNLTVASGNTVSISDYTGSANGFSFNSNSIILSNITASGNFIVAGNTTTSCISVTGPIAATGANSISLTGRNIAVTSNITSQAGDITLYGNGGGTYRAGSFDGVCISGSTVNVNTTSGNITIDGRGGLNSNMAGVNLTSSRVQAGGLGCVTITGVSGNGTNNAYGILAFGATVTTSTGSLKVNGTSCGTGTYSQGVYLNSSANISATGAGNVTITGIAANGADLASGIYVNGACVTTNSGSLTVNGTSCGTGDGATGVFLTSSSNISDTGTGHVTITGTAANGTNYAWGIYVGGTNITTSSGALTVNGTSCGTGTYSRGVYLFNNANISATGAGNVTITGCTPGNTATGMGIVSLGAGDKIYSNAGLITLTANSLNLVGTVNATTAGNVLIQTLGAGVNLGGADSSANLGLTPDEIGQITANMLTIGDSTSGNIAISDAISFGNLTLRTGGRINETGAGQLSVAGTANFVAIGNITLNNATNDFGTLKASGTAISIADSNDLVFGATGTDITAITGGALTVSTNPITSSGNVNLTAVGLIRNIAGGINATSGTGTIRLTSSANSIVQTAAPIQGKGDITLNAFGNVTVDGAGVDTSTGIGNITLVSSSSFVIVNGSGLNSSAKVNANAVELITVQGNAIRANGVIQLTSSANSIVSTSSAINGRSDIGLNAAGNITISGGGMTTASGSGNITLTSTGSFITTGGGGVTSSGNINAAAAGLITVTDGGMNATIGSGNVTLSSTANGASLGVIRSKGLAVNTAGAIIQTGAANVSTGTANFVSAGAISLTQSNNFGTVTANGANITINDVDGVNIGNIQSTGNLTITSGGTTNLGANITTSGDQLFNSPAMLTNNVTLRTTSNGNASFASTLNGAYTLTANLGLGSLINLGAVGSSTTLNLFSVGSISGSDLNLTIATGAVVGSITGIGSNNTITIQTLANQTTNIVISGTNSGNITTSAGTSVGSFSGITRLVGGAGSDTFKLVNNSALLNGTIDGGSGTNALNYSGTTKPTFINLGTGQATGVTSTTSTGVVTNVQNVFGGTGNDFLTGSAGSNVMDGGAGDDTMSGLGGNDIMVGNYGADNMNGGAGIDILIGGYVDFVVGSLQDGLESIMSTWTNVTDGTFNAVSNTIGTASSTQPRLVGDTNLASTYLLQTVFNDQATDRLTDIASSTTPNWFFATERVTQGNDVVQAGTTFTVSKKTVTSKRARTAR
jgi:hypothetical protein